MNVRILVCVMVMWMGGAYAQEQNNRKEAPRVSRALNYGN